MKIFVNDFTTHFEEYISTKKHIVITGDRGSGKSTLLKNVVNKLYNDKSMPGIVTWCEQGKAVYMRLLETSNAIVIGKYDQDIESKENRMKAVKDAFDVKGVDMLLSLVTTNSEWITIDEIGYLEASSDKYLKMLDEVFDKKRVLAVLRKQELIHISKILNRKDVLIIDMGDIQA